MKLIVGLGNPGKQYAQTRHNVGFIAVDELAHRHSIELDKQKFNGIFGTGVINGEKVILLKPLTYMNLSGESVRPIMDYYNIDVNDLVVIYDDLDLPTGKIRLRTKGSAGGQNGMKSVIQHIGTQEFKRIRIGIDRPQNGMKISDYVLSRFHPEEVNDVVNAIKLTADACETWLKQPFLDVMNQYNSSS
ncbi:PTH1 family peptidyl-tRNA hydrolase [Bacillus mesophilus]|uniref:Peptidyl-tRNA hydrolase n=1 Tax=Bacillus mesophilus TaxID=1808955 RepID=A0A6M0QCT8_9BACI|nr:aminoacyl-tRNA hydrolase [Bacillus mesophilus]MBM7663424.1 PTH1 family peptidyl-tRNA hydrolase [Bacillus mesophilus]NEY74126.1 aminoacyl-tRNA hydrolase [Bacillus mesophilus]